MNAGSKQRSRTSDAPPPPEETAKLVDPGAEAAILGGILLKPSLIEPVREVLRSEDFHRETHAAIFRAILSAHGRGVPIDQLTVAAELEAAGILYQIGGHARLAELQEPEIVPVAEHATYYARRVAALARRRREIAELQAKAAELLTEPLDPEVAGPPPGVLLTEVVPEKVNWLWEGRVPLGKLTIVDGDPGLGKSLMLTDLAARVTRSREMPDGSPGLGRPAGVVILTAEDGLADTVAPRLLAAGGDPNRVRALTTLGVGETEHEPVLPDDLGAVEQAIRDVDAKLVIIDPLMAYLGPDVNSHNDQDVRRVMRQLSRLAERTGAAIVIVRHLNKSAGISAIHRGGGSIGIIGAARSGLLVGKDKDDPDGRRRILASVKSNLTEEPESLGYQIISVPVRTGADSVIPAVPVVDWLGPIEATADALVGVDDGREPKTVRDATKDALASLLANGEMEADEVRRTLRETVGASDRTIDRAKAELGVRSRSRVRDGRRRSYWFLPGHDAATDTAKDANYANYANHATAHEPDPLRQVGGVGDVGVVGVVGVVAAPEGGVPVPPDGRKGGGRPPCPGCGKPAAPAVPDGWFCPGCCRRWGQSGGREPAPAEDVCVGCGEPLSGSPAVRNDAGDWCAACEADGRAFRWYGGSEPLREAVRKGRVIRPRPRKDRYGNELAVF